MQLRRFIDAAQRGPARLELGPGGLATLVLGVVALAGSVSVFGGATEDVTQRNGLALRDVSNLHVFTDHRTAWLVSLSRVVSEIGAVPVVGAIALVAGLVLWRRGFGRVYALAPIASLAIAGGAVAVTKHVVGRARPPVGLHLVSESNASFPSGHATHSAAVLLSVAFVVAVVVLRRLIVRVLVVVAAALVTGAIGASRLVLGVHWPSDVLAGWALGLGVALAVTMAAVVIARPGERISVARSSGAVD
ncbi:MAG TPA: phosphatase PAP2 family protein, partial [Mycobacteriales bacterium]|nr:phosphatase PAP2 family protein [Mycobacteriales bacterium]